MTLVKSSSYIRHERRRQKADSSDLLVAALWPKKGENLGTLVRTCDAINAELAVPIGANAAAAVRRGNTIGQPNSPVVWVDEPPILWLLNHRDRGYRLVAVELALGAVSLAELAPMSGPTICVVGHEVSGIPQPAVSMCDEVVEIPMIGVGNSLNVAVAASLVAYKLRGWT